jgi:hypothetical protein
VSGDSTFTCRDGVDRSAFTTASVGLNGALGKPKDMIIATSEPGPYPPGARCRVCRKRIIWPGRCYTCATGLPRRLFPLQPQPPAGGDISSVWVRIGGEGMSG